MLLWAWFTDVRLKKKHIPLSLRLQARLAKPPQRAAIYQAADSLQRLSFSWKTDRWAWLPVHLCKNVLKLPSREQSMTMLDMKLKFYSISLPNQVLSLWTDIQYSDKGYYFTKKVKLSAPTLHYKAINTVNDKQNWMLPFSNLREDGPREIKGEKDINTKVVQCWYLHLAQSLKNKVYLHTDGWSKTGQTTPTEH